jgi:hypothetical protein
MDTQHGGRRLKRFYKICIVGGRFACNDATTFSYSAVYLLRDSVVNSEVLSFSFFVGAYVAIVLI